MDLQLAMEKRHSVRSYMDKPIEGRVKDQLCAFIRQCNQQSGLHMQPIFNEPKAFDCLMAHYGKFSGVKNYIAMIGRRTDDLQEKCGYYGEKIVLYAQTLGLNTCWVAQTYKKQKSAFQIHADEKFCLVIAIGYGNNPGASHSCKVREKVMQASSPVPEWFIRGVDAALLAPTAMNQQNFLFSLKGDKVKATSGLGFYSKVDLGIVKYHFELGAGTENFQWA